MLVYNIMNSKGDCRLCKNKFDKNKFKKHILKCSKKELMGYINGYLVSVDEGQHWIYLFIPCDSTLDKLDTFLKKIWLECYHTSIFVINQIKYSSCYRNELIPRPVELHENDAYESTEIPINNLFEVGKDFKYTHDEGETVYIKGNIISKCVANSENIIILGRNDMPKYICCKCNSDDLNFLCYECENIYCDDCIKNINKHKCLMDVDKYEESYEDLNDFLDDNMIKLNKNSPRIELFPI